MNVTNLERHGAKTSSQETSGLKKKLSANPKGASASPQGTGQAKRITTAILEVLGGLRTPGQAATVLAVSLPRYYLMENRAIQGMVSACEPRPLGRAMTPASELAKLHKDYERLKRDYDRQQAVLRAAQRAVGLPPPAAPDKKNGKRRKRRPVVRALTARARLQMEPAATAEMAADSIPQEDLRSDG